MRWTSSCRLETEADDVLIHTKDGPDALDRFLPLVSLVCMGVAVGAIWTAFRPETVAKEMDINLVCAAMYVGGAIAVLVHRRRRSRRTLGTWRVSTEAIEFVGKLNPGCRLRWHEIERVQWSDLAFKLVGPTCTLEFNPDEIVNRRGPLHDRVAAHLATRFDLDKAIVLADKPIHMLRIIDLALIGMVPFALYCLLIPYLSENQWRRGLLGLGAVGLGVAGVWIFRSMREKNRQLWRQPRGVGKPIELL